MIFSNPATVQLLLGAGIILLCMAAFMGFAQAAARGNEKAEQKWRVVHNGGTAGGVQLLALAGVWHLMPATSGSWAATIALAVVVSTWCFFLGPLARALGRNDLANMINAVGAVAAVPGYFGLPILLF